MSRANSVATHPARDEIERGLIEGVPAAVLSRKYSVHPSSLSRYKLGRLGPVLAEMLSEEPGVPEVLGRLRDLADSTRRSRQLADATGTSATKAKAQANELQVLNFLSAKLGITSLETLDTFAELQQYSNAVAKFLRENPEHLEQFAANLVAESPEWTQYVDDLATHIKKRTKA